MGGPEGVGRRFIMNRTIDEVREARLMLEQVCVEHEDDGWVTWAAEWHVRIFSSDHRSGQPPVAPCGFQQWDRTGTRHRKVRRWRLYIKMSMISVRKA